PAPPRTLFLASSGEPTITGPVQRITAVLGTAAPASLACPHLALPEETHGTTHHPAALPARRAVRGPAAPAGHPCPPPRPPTPPPCRPSAPCSAPPPPPATVAHTHGLRPRHRNRRPRAHAARAARDARRPPVRLDRGHRGAGDVEPVRRRGPPGARRTHRLDPARADHPRAGRRSPLRALRSLRAVPRQPGEVARRPARRVHAPAGREPRDARRL